MLWPSKEVVAALMAIAPTMALILAHDNGDPELDM